ncbi:MAG: macrolide family glycosyltransferase [Clostridiales bacterium]
MAKILFINVASHGHINPTLAIAKELVERGNDVIYLLPEKFESKFKNINIQVQLCKNILDVGNLKYDKINKILKTYLEGFEELFDFITENKEKIDLIIYDQVLFFTELIAKKFNIPTVNSITTFVINEDYFKEILGISTNEVFSLLQNDIEIKEIFSRICNKYKLDLSKLNEFLSTKGTINIVYTSKYFQPYSEEFGNEYKFIGPSIGDRKEDFDLSKMININNQKMKIYISLGTIYNNSIEFYKKCFEAFENFDMDFILSVGKNTDIKNLGYIPNNFSVYDYVPQLEILKYANVFISHGGMNSSNEALYFQVPLLLVPQSVDQPIVAKRVEELNAGIILNRENISSEILRNSLTRLLEHDIYKHSCKELSKSFKNAGGYREALLHIENILNNNLNFKCS